MEFEHMSPNHHQSPVCENSNNNTSTSHNCRSTANNTFSFSLQDTKVYSQEIPSLEQPENVISSPFGDMKFLENIDISPIEGDSNNGGEKSTPNANFTASSPNNLSKINMSHEETKAINLLPPPRGKPNYKSPSTHSHEINVNMSGSISTSENSDSSSNSMHAIKSFLNKRLSVSQVLQAHGLFEYSEKLSNLNLSDLHKLNDEQFDKIGVPFEDRTKFMEIIKSFEH